MQNSQILVAIAAFSALGIALSSRLSPCTNSQSSSDVVRASQVEIVDAAGAVKAVLGLDPTGKSNAVGIYLMDPAGRTSVSLSAQQTASDRGLGMLRLDNSRTGEQISIAPSQDTGIALSDRNGVHRMQFKIRDDSGMPSPAIVLRDGASCVRAELTQVDAGSAPQSLVSLILSATCDEKMKEFVTPSVVLSASEVNLGEISVYGASRNVVFSVPNAR